jgi:hypothetical protein
MRTMPEWVSDYQWGNTLTVLTTGAVEHFAYVLEGQLQHLSEQRTDIPFQATRVSLVLPRR